MRIRHSSFAAAFCALLLAGAPAMANAARTYLLIGTRHIYVIGDDATSYQDERTEIEKTYGDCVSADFATSEYRIQNGATPAQENRARTADLAQLQDDRDECMDELYETRDDLRDAYPEFKSIDIDGPYQVVAVDYHSTSDNSTGHVEGVFENGSMVIDTLTVMKPWPGFETSEDTYGGWVYGEKYTTVDFFDHWHKWRIRHRGKFSLISYRTHAGRPPFEQGRFTGRADDWVVARGYAHATGRLHKKGVIRRRKKG